MIANGRAFSSSQIVEVIDLSSTTTNCANLANFPISTRGTYGYVIDYKTPMLCGGYYNLTSLSGLKDCYQYTQGITRTQYVPYFWRIIR
jgi:hypothetical protein